MRGGKGCQEKGSKFEVRQAIVQALRPAINTQARALLSLAGLVLTAIFCAEVSQAQQPDFVITDLLLSQTRLEPGITPRVDVSFVVTNNGGSTDQPFDAVISGLGDPVTIRTTPTDGHPSADAGESIYFSQTFNAP